MMDSRSPIAIVGYAYRAPGCGHKGLWEFLAQGKDAWSRVPKDRFDQDAFYHPSAEKTGFYSSKGAHFLPDDIYAFDAAFFNIKADEARAMDPQHRLMLECAFEAAESAGITIPDLAGSNFGVFAANDISDYTSHMMEDLPTASKYTVTGVSPAMIANRLSYFFGLTGPSVVVDAACAGSSYALHIACQSLLAGECKAAFVGGAKILNSPNMWSTLDGIGALSPTGRCFSYDSKAAGFGRGEGGACIIIKRLSDALACGDPIRAIVRNTASSHSGRTQGITMPSRAAQEELLFRVHNAIGLDSSQTTFVEGHGTGTQVGDPIEGSAIATVVGSKRSSSNPVYIGSLKSNFGHLEGASGILSVVKSIMMIENGLLLPNAGFEELNPNIESRDRITVLKTVTPWPSGALKRVCITNFGIGGSNAAILLERAPDASLEKAQLNGTSNQINCHNNAYADLEAKTSINVAADYSKAEQLFVFSAKSPASLSSYLSSFVEYLEKAPQSSKLPKNLSFTLGQRRTHFGYRIAVTADSTASLRDQLMSLSTDTKSARTVEPTIAFTFTGQGAQYFQMSAGLFRYKPFAAAIRDAEQILSKLGATWSLTEELCKPEDESRINDAEISQPACTAVQLALVLLLQSWGVVPAAVTGHSSGEIAAAFAAGLVSFEAAIAIAYFRGICARNVQQDCTVQGAMLALGIGADEVKKLLGDKEGYATVAAINSPTSVTISGDVSAINSIQEKAQGQGLFVRRLNVSVAYHSRHMERVAAFYMASIKPFCALEKSPKAVFISSVTGRKESAKTVDASYWVRNLISPVQYLQAVQALFSYEDDIEGGPNHRKLPSVIVEIGPHSALRNPTKQTLEQIAPKNEERKQAQVTYLPSLVRGKDARSAMLDLAGSLFSTGLEIKLAEANKTDPSNAKVVKDLPSYEWSKATRYIHENRVTAQKLHHGRPYDKLLGWKSPYSEGNEHSFRNVFTLDDLPFVRDHNVAGDIIFPFTAFISLATKALIALSSDLPATVLVREFHVTRSLKIIEDQRVDITTKIRPAEIGTEAVSSTIWAFEIMSWSDSLSWTMHSHGLIEADHRKVFTKSPNVHAAAKILDDGLGKLQERDAEQEYTTLRENGVNYGPTFLNMTKLWQAPAIIIHEFKLRQLDAATSFGPSPASVDPPTLDTILQSFGIIQELDGPRPVLVPTSSRRWRLSNHILGDAGSKFYVVSKLLDCDDKSGSMRMSFVVFSMSGGTRTPVAEIDTLTFKRIAQPSKDHLAQGLPETYFSIEVPYVDLIDGQDLSKLLIEDAAPKSELQHRRKMNDVGVIFLYRMLEEIADEDMSHLSSHLSKFLDWSKRLVENYPPTPDCVDVCTLIAEVADYNSAGELLCTVGQRLPEILRGQVEPLEIMLEDGLLARYYDEDTATIRGNQGLARYVQRLAEVNPDLNILEIGAGTASATVPVLEAIKQATEGGTSFFKYTFTDISTGFFEKARTKLSQWPGRVTYEKLDIGRDPVAQGFTVESYDLIIAANVLHATPDIVTTINNVGALLKPNGKLALLELVQNTMPLSLPFALLPGWWLSEDKYRPNGGPLMSKEIWDMLLKSNGFSGVEGVIDDYPGEPEQFFTAMWSTKNKTMNAPRGDAPITICSCFAKDEDGAAFVKAVSEDIGGQPTAQRIAELDTGAPQFYIFLEGSQRSILSDLSSELFYILKTAFLNALGILWVLPDNAQPDSFLIKGLLRTLRLEDSSKALLLVENTPYTTQGATIIAQLAQRLQDSEPEFRKEQEFSVVNGLIHVPRMKAYETAKDTFSIETGLAIMREQNISQCNNALEMTVDAVGSLDSIYFRNSDALTKELDNNEITVQVEAAGINSRDLLLVLGSLPWHAPGLEGAGVVERVGPNVKDLKVGDRVFYVLNQGGWASFVRMSSLRAHKIPNALSTVDAATMPMAYSTAIMCLMQVGRLQKGETVLIHAASGAVGQACIMIAQHLGAIIFATASTPEKRGFLTQIFGIPPTQIFSSRTSEFKDPILLATKGEGIDVIVNSLSGNLLQQTWDLIAENGRFVEIGKKDLLQNNYLPMRPFDKNVTFSGVDLRKSAQKPGAVREWLSTIVDLVQRQVIKPIQPVTTIPISQLAIGLHKLQGGQNIGKFVVTMDHDDKVLAECPSRLYPPSGKIFHPDATYLITGGTGGIGRGLALWMIKEGAKNLVLLSRSGSSSPNVAALLERFKRTDVRLRAVACNVGSRVDLVRTFEDIKDLPRVRGVIHGALYLRDAMFINATFDDWQKITAPKLNAAWYLHELLPNLDFFVSLSSMVAIIGHVGQSIYAGTTTFLDAFSEYRLKQGLPAVSISLPAVQSVGYVADRGIGDRLAMSLGITLTEDQLYTLIKGAIIGPSSGLNVNGKSFSFIQPPVTDVEALPWEDFHFLAAMRRKPSLDDVKSSQDINRVLHNHRDCLDFEVLMDTLSEKISAITMMDREEITPDKRLINYGLDSLVSVELRNWIRREFGVDLALKDIVGAENLKKLLENIMSQKKE